MAGSEIRRQISGMPTGRVALSWTTAFPPHSGPERS